MSTKVILLQSIPGGGKSTYAEYLRLAFDGKTIVCSADKHFVQLDGNYLFDPSQLWEAHQKCMREFVLSITSNILLYNKLLVIVDNTNTRLEELLPYYRVAEAFNCEPEIHTLICNIEKAIARGLHKVPAATVYRMNENIGYFNEHHASRFNYKEVKQEEGGKYSFYQEDE